VTRHAVWIVAAVVASGCAARPDYSVRQADVAALVRPDGAITIHERLTVYFPEPRATRFERHVPLERADSLTFVSAAIDGMPSTPGEHEGTGFNVQDGLGLDAAWTLAAPTDTDRVFELVYRANGAIAVRGTRGTILQTAIASRRPFVIDAAMVRLAIDPSIHVFGGLGLAEAGWSVSRTTDGIAAERQGLGREEGATLMADIAIDPSVVADPAWHRYEEWGRQLIPAFISGGLFMLVIGAGVLWIVRFQYPRRRPPVAISEAEERERAAVRSGLRVTGVVSIVLSGVLALVTWLTLSHFGVWPMSLPVSILLIGVVFLLVGKRIV
jgi:hypothetical protein